MKVLLYNFQQPGESNLGTGGVGVYMQNLLHALIKRNIHVVCLDSGAKYDKRLYETDITYAKMSGYTAATIWNSPVIAPSHENFFAEDNYLQNPKIDWVPGHLKSKQGHIDVFHFQNIEGLTVGFFKRLRQEFPNSKIIFSAHNYNLVCPQVNLWHREKEHCKDYKHGRACVTCIPFKGADYKKRSRVRHDMQRDFFWLPPWALKKLLDKRFLPTDHQEKHFETAHVQIMHDSDMSNAFHAFRAANAELCHSVFDVVLATSEKSKTVLINHGIDAKNVRVSYIGSGFVKSEIKNARDSFSGHLHIAYFGYARKDKGFPFFVSALTKTPSHILNNIKFTIAAREVDYKFIKCIGDLPLKDFKFWNGYHQKDLEWLLSDVHLGIIPPLWEDNLPQVAIEFVANGVPILTSDRGGASEIGNNPDFIFSSGAVESFCNSLSRIVEKKVSLASFWDKPPNIRTVEKHVDELLAIYDGK